MAAKRCAASPPAAEGKKVKMEEERVLQETKTLDESSRNLLDLIFSHEVIEETIKDTKKVLENLPFWPLSQTQIIKGSIILQCIEAALQGNNKQNLKNFSSKFYTTIPHNFGRKTSPVIDSTKMIEDAREKLTALGDIALLLKVDSNEVTQIDKQNLYHNFLNCKLSLLGKDTDNFRIIKTYLENTASQPTLSITDVWEVDRDGEEKRFSEHKRVKNRKLLWHGTTVSSVVAILKKGLKIRSQEGRVGKGIYFASEAYVSLKETDAVDHVRVMFLNEVVLGREAIITEDNENLMEPPEGHHSVVAQGKTEPDPTMDITVQLDGREVDVPQGQPVEQPDYVNSSFDKSEYVIYKESQCRIRYLVLLKDNN